MIFKNWRPWKRFLAHNAEPISFGAVILFCLLSVRTLFEEGIPLTWDHPVHLVSSWNMAANLLPDANPLGYDPYQNLGWVFAQYPLPYMLVAFLSYLSGSLVLAYKLVVTLSYVLPVIALFGFMKAYGFDWKIALLSSFIAASAFPEENFLVSGLYSSAIQVGNIQQWLSIAFMLGFLAVFHLANRKEDSRLELTIFSGGLAALSLLSNPSFGILIIPFSLAYLLQAMLQKRSATTLKRTFTALLIASLVAAGLTAFFSVPFLLDLRGYYPLARIQGLWGTTVEDSLWIILNNLLPFPLIYLALAGLGEIKGISD